VKLRTVTIERFRGVPTKLDLPLRGKSFCLLGENGHGKTTIVDALEFWSSGDVAFYHREGYLQDSLVNVDAQDAQISCETTKHPVLTRALNGREASDFVPAGPLATDAVMPTPMPVLRHRTMADFMGMTAGDKRKTLMELFGLSPLVTFRSTLRTASKAAESDATDARANLANEKAAEDLLLQGAAAVDAAEGWRVLAGLDTAIDSLAELAGLTLKLSPGEPDRLGAVASVTTMLRAVEPGCVAEWNKLVSDPDVATADATARMLDAATTLLPLWPEDDCPLCLEPIDAAAVLRQAQQRGADAAAAVAELNRKRQALAKLAEAYANLARALDRLLAVPPASGWPREAEIALLRNTTREYAASLHRARADLDPAAQPPDSSALDLAALQAAASAAAPDTRAEALAKLVRLRDQLGKTAAAETRLRGTEMSARALAKLLELTDAHGRKAVEDVLKRVGGRAADYYSRLVPARVYSGVTLEYTPGRSGGVEFSLEFDSRHTIKPPQRVMSESQLNALGLALFLARVREEERAWRTLILDDVVNSFDANHRAGLLRLLQEEFAEWQVLVFTHDRVFFDIGGRMVPTWQFAQISAWTPSGGPVIVVGDAVEQLRARLGEGRAASELGGLARVALERELAVPLARLGFPIRYDPHGRYSANDLLQAVRSGLKTKGSEIRRLPVFGRMEADGYLINLGAHDRPADPALTVDDLERLVSDLDAFREAFKCTACGEPVWAADAGSSFHCRCTKLAV